MNEKNVRTFLKNLTEQKAPTAEINLWPAIESHLSEATLQTSKRIESRGNKMKTRQRFALWLAAIAGMAVLLAGVLFLTVTPQGQVIAQNVLRFFNRAEGNVMPGTDKTTPAWVEQTPGVAVATPTLYPTPQGPAFEAVCGTFQSPNCTIEGIRKLVSFPVYALVKLPDGFYFRGATGGPDEVILFYASKTSGDQLIINQTPVTENQYPTAWNVGADAVIQSMMIGSAEGEYVKGSYDGNQNPPVWNENLNDQTLRWINQGIAFRMEVIGKESRIGPAEVVDLATSLTDGLLATSPRQPSVTATSTPGPFDFHNVYPLTLSEVTQQAGFAVLSPSRLPEALSFVGAMYDENNKTVELFYQFNRSDMPELTDGLLIREILIPDNGLCILCGFVTGQYDGRPENAGRWVGENAIVETVQLNGATAYYVEGAWKGTDCCGWVWETDPYMKQLRWQVNGKAFELSYMGMAIDKEDLISIANGFR